MIYSIAALQFVLLSLGMLVVHLSVKIASSLNAVPPLVRLLSEHGIYLFLVPAVWVLLANAVAQRGNPKNAEIFVRTSGTVLTIAIGCLFVVPVLRLLF